MEDKLVEGLEVRREHDKRQERLEEDGGGEGGKLQLTGVRRKTPSRQLRAEHKFSQIGEIAGWRGKRKEKIVITLDTHASQI